MGHRGSKEETFSSVGAGRYTLMDPSALHDTVADTMNDVLVGQTDVVEALTVALLTRGHVLLEGVPGVAKTTIARLFAQASGLSVNRIQMTPDVLPADITGTYVYREQTGEFVLRRGPIFANVVIADEINRATPKTQSALLEAMQELQVTIEGDTQSLQEPFMVVATQNPVEMEGTFELPVAQRDRFQQKIQVPIPQRHREQELLERFDADPTLGPDVIASDLNPDEIPRARAIVDDVHVAAPVNEYVLDIVAATRDHADVEHGASPRAAIELQAAAKARAAMQGRAYVIPDDVKGQLERILAHRLVLATEATLSEVTAQEVMAEIAEDVPPPGAEEHTFTEPGVRASWSGADG